MYYTALRGLARTSRHSYSLQTKITNPIEGEEGNSDFCIDVIKNIAWATDTYSENKERRRANG